jgi:hypothetical protein
MRGLFQNSRDKEQLKLLFVKLKRRAQGSYFTTDPSLGLIFEVEFYSLPVDVLAICNF